MTLCASQTGRFGTVVSCCLNADIGSTENLNQNFSCPESQVAMKSPDSSHGGGDKPKKLNTSLQSLGVLEEGSAPDARLLRQLLSSHPGDRLCLDLPHCCQSCLDHVAPNESPRYWRNTLAQIVSGEDPWQQTADRQHCAVHQVCARVPRDANDST